MSSNIEERLYANIQELTKESIERYRNEGLEGCDETFDQIRLLQSILHYIKRNGVQEFKEFMVDNVY